MMGVKSRCCCVLMVIVLIATQLANTVHSQRCAEMTTCRSCVLTVDSTTSVNSTECVWCTLTSECISASLHCPSFPLQIVGSYHRTIMKKGDEAKDLGALSQCNNTISDVSECVVGGEYAKVYTSISKSVRNMKDGGLAEQPILPVPDDIIQYYFQKSANDVGDLGAIVASFIYESSSVKSQQPFTFTPSPILTSGTIRANYSLSDDGDKLIVTRNGRGGKKLHHIYLTNTGLAASPGRYKLGFLVALYPNGSSIYKQRPVCLAYQIPTYVKVTPVYKDILLGIYLYLGVPLCFVTSLVLILFAKFCPFSDQKSLADKERDREQKFMEQSYQKDWDDTDDTTTDTSTFYNTTSEKQRHAFKSQLVRRQKFDLEWYWKFTTAKFIKQCGFQAYYHYKFYRRTLIILTVVALFVLSILTPIHVSSKPKARSIADFAVTTAGNMKSGSLASIAHYILSIMFYIMCAINVGLTTKLIFFKKKTRQCVYTLQITYLPPLPLNVAKGDDGSCVISNSGSISERETLLQHHFNEVVQEYLSNNIQHPQTDPDIEGLDRLDQTLLTHDQVDPVLCVSCVADIAHLIPKIDAMHHLEWKLKDPLVSLDAKLKLKYEDKLQQARDALHRAASKKPLSSSKAFITFKSVVAAQAALKTMNAKKLRTPSDYSHEIGELDVWRVEETNMEPSEIIWENIDIKRSDRILRLSVVYTIFIVLIAIIAVGALVHQLTQGASNLAIIMHSMQSNAKVKGHSKFVQFIFKILQMAYNMLPVTIAISVEIMGAITYNITRIEKVKTVSRFQASNLVKSLGGMALLMTWLPFLKDTSIARFSNLSYYNNSTMKLVQFVFAQTFINRGFKQLTIIIITIVRYFRSGGEPERLHFDFVTSYSKGILIFFVILSCCTQMPLIVIPGLLFFLLNYFLDTFLMIFFFEKSNVTGTAEIEVVSILMFYAGWAGVLAVPRISTVVTIILSTTFAGFTIAVTVLLLTVFILFMRARRSQDTHRVMQDESQFYKKYNQPHLIKLLRVNETPNNKI